MRSKQGKSGKGAPVPPARATRAGSKEHANTAAGRQPGKDAHKSRGSDQLAATSAAATRQPTPLQNEATEDDTDQHDEVSAEADDGGEAQQPQQSIQACASSSSSASDTSSEESTWHSEDGAPAGQARRTPASGGRQRQPRRKEGDGRAPGASQDVAIATAKRSFADMLAGDVDDATLRSVYAQLPQRRWDDRVRQHANLMNLAPTWHLLMRNGFSVLLHGVGSKRDVLQCFVDEQLTDGTVVVCNGFVPSLTAHKVLAAAVGQLVGRSCRACGSAELLTMLGKEARDWPNRHVYVVVHNIDGPGLRSEAEQATLAAMAAAPNCHLIASCDHVNSALLWQTAIAATFRWVWFTAHTYEPHVAEVLDRASVLLGHGKQAQRRGAGAVLRSMPENGRAAFGLLAAAQAEDPELEGLDFKRLFRMCREQFLYTSESALRAALTEFIDHELVATRQASDGGGELLHVPMDATGLRKVLEELEVIKAEAGGA